MKKKTIVSFKLLNDLALTEEHHAHELQLSSDEYDRVKRLLGRVPNKVELGIIGAMWSERCSNKSSRAHLSRLPTKGKAVLRGPGENASAIHIGDEQALVFKIESHNHKSFIDPFQGAATGVGGVLRDIFTTGARPFALANLLRFGSPTHKKVPSLLDGALAGMASYGNSFGVPTVLSNIDFHEAYNGNNLVNVFAIGVVHKDEIFLGAAAGLKNRVLYVGAKTGQDRMMSAVDTPPVVPIGDPLTGKLLYHACLSAFKEKLVVGIQDMSAAGLIGSALEMANRASTGLLINLDHVPLGDESMTAYDIMLSESQERMLMVVKPLDVLKVKEICLSFGVDCIDVGCVTGDGLVRIHHKGRDVVDLSATLILENAPRYRRDYLSEVPFSRMPIKDGINVDVHGAIETFIKDLGQRSLSFIATQFHSLGLNTVVGPNEADAVLITVPDNDKAVAISLLANGKLCRINPFEGASRTVFQAALEISAQGAQPIGITNCLNFGSPENIEVMTDFKHVIDGMAHGAICLDVPIISGNVSLYNETLGQPILPTLALCLVGLNALPAHHTKFQYAKSGDLLILLGDLADDYAGSEAVVKDRTITTGARPWDPDAVLRLSDVIRQGVISGFINAASVIGHGGLLHSLIKIMAHAGVGMTVDFGEEWLSEELALGLLSEDSPQVLLAVNDIHVDAIRELCIGRVPINYLGRLFGDLFAINHLGRTIFTAPKNYLIDIFNHGLRDYLTRMHLDPSENDSPSCQ